MTVTIRHGDCREILQTLPDQSVHCCVTSPPYFGLRDYGHAGQIGLEATPDAFVAEMIAVFEAVRSAAGRRTKPNQTARGATGAVALMTLWTTGRSATVTGRSQSASNRKT
jgi:DNA modification methylase